MQRFSKCGPHTTGIRITLQLGVGTELIAHAESWAPAQTCGSSPSGSGAQESAWFIGSPGDCCAFTFYNLWARMFASSSVCIVFNILLWHLYCVHVFDRQLPDVRLEAR